MLYVGIRYTVYRIPYIVWDVGRDVGRNVCRNVGMYGCSIEVAYKGEVV